MPSRLPGILVLATQEEIDAWTDKSKEAEISRNKWIREVLNSAAGYRPKRARKHPSIKP